MISIEHAQHLAGALSDVLGRRPSRGDVAFVRCLASELVDALITHQEFSVPGFRTYAVVDRPGPKQITADVAVELREDKGDPVLFLIDPVRAGAGLDGIYSAAREVGERELLDKASLRA